MAQDTREFVTELEFDPEMAGRRIGWSAVRTYSNLSDYAVIDLATTTISEDGATLRYQPREEDGVPSRAYWSDSAAGFIATAGISITVDKTRPPEAQLPDGPSFAFNDNIIKGSSDGIILRTAGGGRGSDEEELREKRVWADSNVGVMRNIKLAMGNERIMDYYPIVYYTANVLLGHEHFRAGSGIRRIEAEDLLLPDEAMADATYEEIKAATTVSDSLNGALEEDKEMLTNLTIFGSVPSDQVPAAFKASRGKVYEAEEAAKEAAGQLRSQVGMYLPVGYPFGGRTWPYMDASLPPDDEASFGGELDQLSEGKTRIAERELERERDELERRIQFIQEGVVALKILSKLEIELQQ